MRWPFFGGGRKDKPIELNLPTEITPGFVVFFCAEDLNPPDPSDLLGVVKDWLSRHSSDPLRSLLANWIDRGMLVIHVLTKSKTPPLDLDDLRHKGMNAEQERRLEKSTHAAMVVGNDLGLPPHPGLWVAIAAAQALVEALDGVAFDPALRRAVPRDLHAESPPELGQVVLPVHLAFDLERSRNDRQVLVGRGMSKFGLPDLELRGVPPDLIKESTAILGGLAALLAGWAMPLRDASEGKPFKARLDRE